GLADERDALGPPVARVSEHYDDNDRRMTQHALARMSASLAALRPAPSRPRPDRRRAGCRAS
ncbi:hypothetical protein, partial [Burkholderia sp. Cy-647]|uniref:hypothetical protein n=1 Tax=Burkholderia sp. Cy-647 TaxID=2608328 RepID=UPI0019661379